MTLRRLRLRAVWLLVVPFFWLARPTGMGLAVGAAVAMVGLALRAWASGVIRKEQELATAGPYAHTRNPLYLGSLLLGTGVSLAGGHWIWPLLFLAFYALVYGRTMAAEEALLAERFGDRYRAWAAQVPPLLPRWTAWREAPGGPGGVSETATLAGSPNAAASAGFTWSRYRANREWEAALGFAAGLGVLFAKWADWVG